MTKINLPLLAIFVLILTIRLIPILQRGVSFHYDMARDAFAAQDILKGDLKIVGPPSSTSGLFHGALFYYLLAILYWIGRGNPVFVSSVFTVISSLSVIPIYFLAKEFFRSEKMGILAGLLFAISFEAAQYAPWLSNPSLALPALAWYFYGLWLWKNNKKTGFLIAVISAILATQFQLFLAILFVNILLFKIIFKPKLDKHNFGLAIILSLLGLSSYLVAFFKFQTFGQIWGILASRIPIAQHLFRVQFTDVFLNYVNRTADVYITNFFPTSVLAGGALGIVSLAVSRTSPFVIFGLLTSFPIFILGGHNSNYVNVGMVFPAILSVLLLLKHIFSKNKIASGILLAAIVVSNLLTILKLSSRGQVLMVIPKDMVVNNQLALIDKTYEISAGRPFSINTLTLPLWINSTWSYLYNWYGKSRYGYIPSFYGHDQIGSAGAGVLPQAKRPLNPAFFIIEPQDGIPQNLVTSELSSENSKTEIVNQYDYGALVLQERRVLNQAP